MANFLTLNGNHVGKAPTISSKLMDITVTLVSSGWDSTTKKQVVTIPDMPSTAMPVVVPLDSDLTNYALLDGMDIEAGKITFIASEVPSGDINIMLKGVVASKQDMVALTQGYVNRLSVLETQNGTETLTTESKTLSGGVNEIKSSLTKYKDIEIRSAITKNTWYSYNYGADSDLVNATILSVYCVTLNTSDGSAIVYSNLNLGNKIIWYHTNIDMTAKASSSINFTLRVAYI